METAHAHSVDVDGTAHVPSFEMPYSSLASDEARSSYVEAAAARTASDADAMITDIAVIRRRIDDEFVLPLVAKQHARWPGLVSVEPNEVKGVYTEVIRPKQGVSEVNRSRVLVNVHGGGFMVGARAHGQLESIPIAALGEIEVVSVDYRMAPEFTFPAACEDLAVVYESLLSDYEPASIGIYGSSAGGVLAAQAVPWFLEHDLPLPGALGMLGGSGQSLHVGDSAALGQFVFDGTASVPAESGFEALPYFKGVDAKSRLAAPMLWADVLARFPPSLLVTSARAFEMSSIIDAHNKLVLAGVESRLHVWDGLGHCFYLNPELPESREVERIVVDFFGKALGGEPGLR